MGPRSARSSVPDSPPPASEPWVLHETLLELLKRLNQAHERAGDDRIEGLELTEVERAMAPFRAARTHEVDLPFALQLLVENGLAKAEDRPAYAWDRRRVLGERFLITTDGKAYLRRQLDEAGRVP
jgi:hypothetical protein